MTAGRDPREPSDLPQDWWRTQDVLRYAAALGQQIPRTTWSTWVRREEAPAADHHYGAYPRWRPQVIRDWFVEFFGDPAS